MPIIATATEGRTYTPAPTGVHQAVLVDIIDKGNVEVTWQGKTKIQRKVDFVWQIGKRRDDDKRYLVFKRYTLSLSEKANLRKDLEGWRGTPFTRDDEMGFDIETMLGQNCLVNIQHRVSGDKTYANVVAVMPLIDGMPAMTAEDYKRPETRTADTAQQPEDETQHSPVSHELTDDDIPFAWIVPFLLPAAFTLHLVSAAWI